jgi:hypothetical protein
MPPTSSTSPATADDRRWVSQAGWLGYSGHVYPLGHIPSLAVEPRGHRPLYAAGAESAQTARRDVVALLQLVNMTDTSSAEPIRLIERGAMFDPSREGLALAQVGWLHPETGEVYPLSGGSVNHGKHHPLYISVGVVLPGPRY